MSILATAFGIPSDNQDNPDADPPNPSRRQDFHRIGKRCDFKRQPIPDRVVPAKNEPR